MALVVRAFPIRRDRRDVESFVAELRKRTEETRRFFESFGVRREAWFLQTAEKRSYVIGVTDVAGPLEETARSFATTTDDFAQWFQSRVYELSGVDEREQPLGPPTSQVFDSTGDSYRPDGTLATRMYPVKSVGAVKELVAELQERDGETRRFYDSFEVKEAWFVQETPDGPFAIAVTSMHGDVARNVQAYARSQDPFAAWFKQRVSDVSGVDPNQKPLGPESEMIFEFNSSSSG